MKASGTGHKDVRVHDANASFTPVARKTEVVQAQKKQPPTVNTNP
jgi:hypothetical protein